MSPWPLLAIGLPAAASPVVQSDSHCDTARETAEEEPSGVGNINKGPDHNHRTPKEPHRTFNRDFVDSDTRMYFHFYPTSVLTPPARLPFQKETRRTESRGFLCASG